MRMSHTAIDTALYVLAGASITLGLVGFFALLSS
jgi:nitrogen fixation-related uncharacterized protein